MVDPGLITDSLIAAAAAVFAVAVLQGLRWRLRGGRSVRGDSTAYGSLSEALRSADPKLPAGFTWREAMARMEEVGIKGDWGKFAEELERYEGQRYGGDIGGGSFPETARVARIVWRLG